MSAAASKTRVFSFPQYCGDVSDLDCLSYVPEDGGFKQYEIDMSRIEFIRPGGVIGLLTLLERLNSSPSGKKVNIILPNCEEVCAYFSQIRLLDALQTICSVGGKKTVIERVAPRITPLVPVSSFSTSQEVEDFAIRIEETMQREPGLAPLLGVCYLIATELASNIVEHSQHARGWILAQRYNLHTGPVIEMAVGDAGIGLRASLCQNQKWAPLLTDDVAAVKLAVREGVSRHRETNRGYGLTQICQRIHAKERRLMVRSGAGCLVVYDSGRQVASQRKPIVGVLVTARIPC